MEIVDRSAIASLYQLGKLSPEGVARYQSGQDLTKESFRDSSAATYAYQHGQLTGSGLLAYQRGQLTPSSSWHGFGDSK